MVWLWVLAWVLLSTVVLVLVVAVARGGEQEEAMRARVQPEDGQQEGEQSEGEQSD